MQERTLEIRRRFAGDTAIFDLVGRLAVSAAETEIMPLRAAVCQTIAEGHVDIALNLAGLISIDGRGLGELVALMNRLRRLGGDLTLVAPPPRVTRMLSVTRLDQLLRITEREREIVQATACA
jgi:anti-anti-sigma factor